MQSLFDQASSGTRSSRAGKPPVHARVTWVRPLVCSVTAHLLVAAGLAHMTATDRTGIRRQDSAEHVSIQLAQQDPAKESRRMESVFASSPHRREHANRRGRGPSRSESQTDRQTDRIAPVEPAHDDRVSAAAPSASAVDFTERGDVQLPKNDHGQGKASSETVGAGVHSNAHDLETGGVSAAEMGLHSGQPAWLLLREAIERQVVYPALARRRGWQGKVVLSFILQVDGSVIDLEIIQSTGYAILDQGASQAVFRALPFPRGTEATRVVMPIEFKLLRE